MKRKWKSRFVVFGCLGLAGGLLVWWARPPQPKVSFLEFRGSGPERVAVFTIENRSRGEIFYEEVVTLERDGDQLLVRASWQGDIPQCLLGTVHVPMNRAEFTVPLTNAEGKSVAHPFRVNVGFIQSPPPLMKHPPFSWLPKSWLGPNINGIWSEVVTP